MKRLQTALALAQAWERRLAPYCDRICIAGSIRRRKDLVKDIEICCIPKTTIYEDVQLFSSEVRTQRHPGFIQTLTDSDDLMVEMGNPSTGKYVKCMLIGHDIRMDVFILTPDNWGYLLAIRTGPAEYSHRVLANRWSKLGYHGHEGMLMDGNTPIPLREEEDLYRLLQIPMPEPQNRHYP